MSILIHFIMGAFLKLLFILKVLQKIQALHIRFQFLEQEVLLCQILQYTWEEKVCVSGNCCYSFNNNNAGQACKTKPAHCIQHEDQGQPCMHMFTITTKWIHYRCRGNSPPSPLTRVSQILRRCHDLVIYSIIFSNLNHIAFH